MSDINGESMEKALEPEEAINEAAETTDEPKVKKPKKAEKFYQPKWVNALTILWLPD